MARIQPLQKDQISPSIQVAIERYSVEGDQVPLTNMKATLAHSLPAFEVYMQWYPLYEQVEKVLGRRLATVFAYGISRGADCRLCTAYFRRKMIDAGDNPEVLFLTSSQKDIYNFGWALGRHHGNVSDQLYNRVAEVYKGQEMVTLLAFAGQMIATNVFNNAAETDIDSHLEAYLPEQAGTRSS